MCASDGPIRTHLDINLDVQLGLTCKFLNKLLADLLAGSYLPRCVVVCSLNSTLVELDIVNGKWFDALLSATQSVLPPCAISRPE